MNQPIRYWKRDCTDQTKIENFLAFAKAGFLGLSDEHQQPYVVPLNYVWYRNAIYFHGADTGRKCDIIQQNARVCFTVSEEYGTIADPVPASTDTAYMSVMIFGQATRVAELDEATAALQAMLEKYVPGYYDQPLAKQHVAKYRSSLNSEVAVYRIDPEHVSAKENPLNRERAFYPGRKVQMDVARHGSTHT
ncbi:pyridoxamine 5'-phosphate oxidase family protein [Brevibacillus migulae]|uniref:pyridoxamine 5'-phosphate oxidase family protein n=1 Tax=Brevibacillus migulae TaxID=1644114 RepID=UPI001F2867B9|nr:pyridoxamine 5'-phosphate oxidase family protein [Brevibacillus migulae]